MNPDAILSMVSGVVTTTAPASSSESSPSNVSLMMHSWAGGFAFLILAAIGLAFAHAQGR